MVINSLISSSEKEIFLILSLLPISENGKNEFISYPISINAAINLAYIVG